MSDNPITIQRILRGYDGAMTAAEIAHWRGCSEVEAREFCEWCPRIERTRSGYRYCDLPPVSATA